MKVDLMDKRMKRLAARGRCVWCGKKFRATDPRSFNGVIAENGTPSMIGPSCEPCAQDIRETLQEACPHMTDLGWYREPEGNGGTVH